MVGATQGIAERPSHAEPRYRIEAEGAAAGASSPPLPPGEGSSVAGRRRRTRPGTVALRVTCARCVVRMPPPPNSWRSFRWAACFELDDIVFDAERACVVVPFRVVDNAVVVEAPWTLSHPLRWGLRSRQHYAAWRRWLVLIFGAVGPAESSGYDLAGPHDVLEVEFDAEESEVVI